MYHLKDICISQLVHGLIKYYSAGEPATLLSDQARAKIFNSFPRVEQPQQEYDIVTDRQLRKQYTWYLEEEVSDEPSYKNKWLYIGLATVIVSVGLIWYYSEADDINDFFGGDDKPSLDKGKCTAFEPISPSLSSSSRDSILLGSCECCY